MSRSLPELLVFLYRSTIGCLFGCFGIRDSPNRGRRSSDIETYSSNSTETVVSRNRKRLNSLSHSEESNGSSGKEKQCNLLNSPHQDLDFEGLKDEAKFLKALGTIPETPAEIRKASSRSGDAESLKFHSWLPNTSIQELNLEKEPDQPPTPDQQCEDCISGSGSSAHEPRSCITSGRIPPRNSTSTEDSDDGSFGTDTHVYTGQTASMQNKNKLVRFNCQSDTSLCLLKSSSYEYYSQSSEQSESADIENLSKLSPYPTPLKLTEDMKTPGTVFPSYIGNMVVGKNPRIRTQYVHSVVNPVESIQHQQVLMEEECDPDQLSGQAIRSFEEPNNATTILEVGTLNKAVEEEMKGEASLSSWIKPLPPSQGANQRVVTFANEDTYIGKTPGSRPILGTVAAHWKEDELSCISPKWWDGNGIPNTMTKYKEDQKVSWHATPFEERLEKALSEKTIISQRGHLNRSPLLDFNDSEVSC